MNGFGRILTAQIRRDRWLTPVWIVSIGLLGLAVGSAINTQFEDDSARTAIVAVATANPAFLFLRGLPDGSSIGAVAFFQAFSFTAVLAGLMSTFMVVRHTRADEELGRSELLASTPIRRSTSLAATITLGVGANAILVVVAAAGYVAGGLPAQGSILAALAVGSVGIFFVGVTAVVTQLMPSGRASNGAAAALVGAAYLIRGIGDALGQPNAGPARATASWLSGLSPIGWGQATRPFSEPTPWPLAFSLVGFITLALTALALQRRRDIYSSLVADRVGRGSAVIGGQSLFGLAWRLQRSTLIGWCIGVAVLGSIAGGLGPVVAEAVEGNPSLAELIARLVPGSSTNIVDIFTAALLGISGVLAAAAGVQGILRLRIEEAEGRAESILATPRSRARWVGSNLLTSAISVLLVCAVAGSTAGIAIAKSSSDPSNVGRFTAAALAHAPAALVFVAVTALVFAVAPRLTTSLGWGLLVIGLVLGQFGELLRLPEWLQDVSPFRHSSAAPVEDIDAIAAVVLLATATVAAGAASLLLRRRDLVT